MNNLASVSKILYDREVIQKNKENYELKQELKKYKTPKVYFENTKDWEDLKQKFLVNLKKIIKNWIYDEHHWQYFDEFKAIDFSMDLTKLLLNLTKNKEWSEYHSNYISEICLGIIIGSNIYDKQCLKEFIELREVQLNIIEKIIYNSIYQILFVGLLNDNGNGLLDEYNSIFIKCIKCNKYCDIYDIYEDSSDCNNK